MILPLYGGCLDCGCKVQVTGYMYSNIESNPNLLLMLTSFNFAYTMKFGRRLVLCLFQFREINLRHVMPFCFSYHTLVWWTNMLLYRVK